MNHLSINITEIHKALTLANLVRSYQIKHNTEYIKCLQPQGNVWIYGISGLVNTATLVIYQTELNLTVLDKCKIEKSSG